MYVIGLCRCNVMFKKPRLGHGLFHGTKWVAALDGGRLSALIVRLRSRSGR